MPEISVPDLHHALTDGGEIAVLDVRDHGDADRDGTLLLAVVLPLSWLELRIASFVPRRGTRIVVLDADGADLARRAAARLAALGYHDVAVLAGGVAAWSAAGHNTYQGTQVAGQAFGEWVEHAYGTPSLTAEEVADRISAGADIVVLDSRPFTEYHAQNIPTSINCPGAELVYRAAEVVPDPQTLVVVNCMGRTRSILGAQSLINAGLPNPVAALSNGTMGWLVAGLELEHGAERVAPDPGPAALAWAADAAQRIGARFGVRRIDRATLDRFRAEADERTLFVFDVRAAADYARGHLPESRSVPAPDLVPWLFRFTATRRARVVLVDGPDLIRAIVAASWLEQVDWSEIYLLGETFDGPEVVVESGPAAAFAVFGPPSALPPGSPVVAAPEPGALIDPATLARHLAGEGSAAGVTVLDLEFSPLYAAGHIPGAWFAVRSRLAEAFATLDAALDAGTATVVLTSENGVLAGFAAAEARELTEREILVLDGGTAAWRDAGLPLEDVPTRLATPATDIPAHAGGSKAGQLAWYRHYLAWETDLVRQISDDDTVSFRHIPADATADVDRRPAPLTRTVRPR
ncbi:rhodanese-like domain-containing protein [Frankia tisae]|uniref:rhodanese-like domain-containing protein n=1 Tax=Frankia tisae TaxID=2950104 RepID=UPI0021C1E742|nr:rhodanese-like domain-containing protein [Frankia tisae]